MNEQERERAEGGERERAMAWRNDAFEQAARIAERYGAQGAADDIRVLVRAEPRPEAERQPERDLADEVLAELRRARAKFPGENVTTLAMVEEVGELAKATFEESRERVRKEAVQVATMAMRVVLDGDSTLDAWRAAKGLDPLTSGAAPSTPASEPATAEIDEWRSLPPEFQAFYPRPTEDRYAQGYRDGANAARLADRLNKRVTPASEEGERERLASALLRRAAERRERELREVVNAWWCRRRPVKWTAAEHAANPTVNCADDVERGLAEVAARALSQDEPDNP